MLYVRPQGRKHFENQLRPLSSASLDALWLTLYTFSACLDRTFQPTSETFFSTNLTVTVIYNRPVTIYSYCFKTIKIQSAFGGSISWDIFQNQAQELAWSAFNC